MTLTEPTRGYVGIGIVRGRYPVNLESLTRSAGCFGADFVFAADPRHAMPRSPDASVGHEKHIPVHSHESVAAWLDSLPTNASLVAVETDDVATSDLPTFDHPERAVYALGSERDGLPNVALEAANSVVSIPSDYCLNVATAGAMVLYDRRAKSLDYEPYVDHFEVEQ